MKLAGVHLFVRDMAAALAFYRRMGLVFPDGAERQAHVALEFAGGLELSFATEPCRRGAAISRPAALTGA